MMLETMIAESIVENEWGFFQRSPMPTDAELKKFYEEEYFQGAQGSYELVYSEQEMEYWRLKAWLIREKASQIVSLSEETNVLDVGCGEGWYMEEFKKVGCRVKGIDFSKFGIEKFHPHLLAAFEQGNVYELLDEKINQKEQHDILILSNVIEHVTDPGRLLGKLSNILIKGGLLIVHAPNNFSPVQKHALKRGYIDHAFWTDYKEHLSFFSKESMEKFVSSFGFKLESVVADNAIDLNLFNENTNYVQDRSKGRSTHMERVEIDNLLASIDRTKLLQVREIMGSMGVGRGLTYYFTLN
jgi:2-polyprenyl-3-methyl-5-hydroxy-6-metoxy-1,4-benzoquinol methylase